MTSRSTSPASNHSTNGSQSSRAERAAPIVRTPTEGLAILTGEPVLTEANLVKQTWNLANATRTFQAPSKVEALAEAAKSLGFELPAKTKIQLMEQFAEMGPMDRFLRGTEGDGVQDFDEEFWAELVETDELAAETESLL